MLDDGRGVGQNGYRLRRGMRYLEQNYLVAVQELRLFYQKKGYIVNNGV